MHSNFTPTKEKNWKEYSVDGARLLTRHQAEQIKENILFNSGLNPKQFFKKSVVSLNLQNKVNVTIFLYLTRTALNLRETLQRLDFWSEGLPIFLLLITGWQLQNAL